MLKNEKELKAGLAKTIGIKPEDIMDCVPLGGGKYNVITFNFMKFVNIEPSEMEPEDDIIPTPANVIPAEAGTKKTTSRRRRISKPAAAKER